jgi:3-hydroxyacyl-[acyl-carrier-protein] dehydratase
VLVNAPLRPAAEPRAPGRTFIDRIIEHEEGRQITGIKNITMTADYFNDHFPLKPIVPGVLIMEALTGCARMLIERTLVAQGAESKKPVLSCARKVKFRKFVQPGDQLLLHVQMESFQPHGSTVSAKALVHDKRVATLSAEFNHMNRDEYIKTFLS